MRISSLSAPLRAAPQVLERFFIGRINRAQFFLVFLAWALINGLYVFGFWYWHEKVPFHNPGILAMILTFLVVFGSSFIFVSALCRRLHDMGAPGWLVLIPAACEAMFLVALVAPGSPRENLYGSVPEGKWTASSLFLNARVRENDAGERWLAIVSVILADFCVLFLVLTTFNIDGLDQLSGHTTYTLSPGKTLRVDRGESAVVCKTETVSLKSAPDVTDLSSVLGSIVDTCSSDFEGKIYYGDGNVYYLWVDNDQRFAAAGNYWVVATQQRQGKQVSQDLRVAIYDHASSPQRVESDTIPETGLVTYSPLSFGSFDNDGQIGLRVSAPLPQDPNQGSRVYIFDQKTGTFTRWVQASYSSRYSYLLTDKAAYYDGAPLIGADPVSFQIFSTEYAKDKAHVYFKGQVLPDRDAPSFELLHGGDSDTFSKDKDHAYVDNAPIPGADPKTFSYLSGSYARDASHVYYLSSTLPGADPKTFEILESLVPERSWSRDAHHAYFNAALVEGADVKTFAPINKWFAKDATHLFYTDKAVAGADMPTLQTVISDQFEYVKDQYRVYVGGYGTDAVIPGADPASFMPLGNGYAKDKNHVYQGASPMLGVDPATFKVSDTYRG